MTRALRWLLGVALVLLGVLVVGWLVWVPRSHEPPYRRVARWGGAGTAPGRFQDPIGIAVADGKVFVADSRNHRIEVFDRNGRFLHTIGHAGSGPGGLGRPMNLAVADGKLYVADYWNDDIQIFSLDGTPLQTIGRGGAGPGQLQAPSGVAVRPNGNLLVADFYNQRVQELRPDGAFVRQWGTTGKKGYVFHGGFNYPTDVVIDRQGLAYVADGYNDRIQVFAADGRFLRMWGGPMGLHLPASINVLGALPGWFRTPTALAIGSHGDVFVADEENSRIQKFSASGRFLTAFGTPAREPGYTETGVAVAEDGTVYSTNLAGNDVEVWKPAASSIAR
ncbi:MAG: 6-bladed beta-propeller [Xanthomonadaceae bacterium]|nr:6-bladed beta-propeller [Xanthomonadaceae bacterium]MDE2278170.1 6-bladed beta-propeller [Xanthomonadaceae bacterium]MDE2316546.1 6-bladed beta-propeller [Xanthomonadaceae bacterium]